MFKKILVPLDGSALATCVLPHVVAIAQAMDADITLLHVLESHSVPAGAVNPVDWQLHKMEAQASLNALGVQVGQCLARLPSVQIVIYKGRLGRLPLPSYPGAAGWLAAR